MDFSTLLAEGPLVVNDLREAACEQALRHGLLETRHQFVHLALPGFQEDPCDCLSQAVTEEELQDWLTYLQSLSPEERSCFHNLPSEGMSDDSVTSGLEASSESGLSEELGSDSTERRGVRN